MKYSDFLPRKAVLPSRCQSINDDGNRCDNMATYEVELHQDKTTGGDLWVAVKLCDECSKRRKSRFQESDEMMKNTNCGHTMKLEKSKYSDEWVYSCTNCGCAQWAVEYPMDEPIPSYPHPHPCDCRECWQVHRARVDFREAMK